MQKVLLKSLAFISGCLVYQNTDIKLRNRSRKPGSRPLGEASSRPWPRQMALFWIIWARASRARGMLRPRPAVQDGTGIAPVFILPHAGGRGSLDSSQVRNELISTFSLCFVKVIKRLLLARKNKKCSSAGAVIFFLLLVPVASLHSNSAPPLHFIRTLPSPFWFSANSGFIS